MDVSAGASGLARTMLLAGPAAALVFALGVAGLGSIKPGYSHVSQTVSELGAQGEEGRKWLAALNLVVALLALVFASGLLSVAKSSAVTNAPAWLVGLWAILAVGLAAFPSGHRLHNVFGLLQTIPFVGAPVAVARGWQGLGVGSVSRVALLLLVVAMVLNLAPAFSRRIANTLAPVYGLVQRSLFVAWYGWCATLGLLLFMRA
jgi:hypothetical membrane protein